MATEPIWTETLDAGQGREPTRVENTHGLARAWTALQNDVARQTDNWPLWFPVGMASGAAVYMVLPIEPNNAVFATAAGIVALAAMIALRKGPGLLTILLISCLAGFLCAKAKTVSLAGNPLPSSTGEVSLTGWVIAAERKGRKQARVVLKVDTLVDIQPQFKPDRVRLTIASMSRLPETGTHLNLKAKLYRLPSPVMPGGHNFGRSLWFQGIDATGFAFKANNKATTDQKLYAGPGKSWIAGLRDEISQRVHTALQPRTAGLAEALLLGRRAGIDSKDREALQTAGLAHILAISGLHMTLVAGGLFWLVRALLALSPTLALNRPIKKWAAAAALLAGLFYLLLSGSGVATQRAFVMLAVMCLAVFCDRPAFSMRNLAIAAVLVILIAPQTVVSPSFQMSFLAVMGLIAGYEVWSDRKSFWLMPADGILWPAVRWILVFVAATAATTFIASTMTALPAAFHFQRFAPYSVIANVFALPIVTLLVMPALLMALFLMPLGLETMPLVAAGEGMEAVLSIAHWVSGFSGASIPVSNISATTATIAAAGAIWLCLWKGRARMLGLPVAIVALWSGGSESHKPEILVEQFARNVAFRNEQGLLVPANNRRGRFAVERWLATDGDDSTLAGAHKRKGWTCKDKVCHAKFADKSILYLSRGAKATSVCKEHKPTIVIAAYPLRKECSDAKIRIDRFDLWREGAHAIHQNTHGEIVVSTVSKTLGIRPWTVKPVARKKVLTADALKRQAEARKLYRAKARQKSKQRNDIRKPAKITNQGNAQ